MFREKLASAIDRKNNDINSFIWKGRKQEVNGVLVQEEKRLVDCTEEELRGFYAHCDSMLYNTNKDYPGRYVLLDIIKDQRQPDYNDEVVAQEVQISNKGGVVMDMDGPEDDSLYQDAVRCVIETGKASASLLQRRLRVGYGRASRLIDSMEEQGLIGPADGARSRDVLVTSMDDVFGDSPDSEPEPEED